MERFDLPEGWKWCKLSNHITSLQTGGRPKGGVAKYSQGVPSISAEQISENGEFYWDNIKYVPVSFYNSSQKGRLSSGDILIVKDGATAGKCAFIDDSFPHKLAMVNEHTFILRTKASLLPKFAFLWLRSSFCTDYFEDSRQHGIKGGLNSSFTEEIEIPVPPLPEQWRIVARIEELTKRVEEARQFSRGAADEAELSLRSAIAEIFDKSDSAGWHTKKVRQICENPQYGYTESASAEPVGPRFLRITDIQNGSVNWNLVPYCQCDALEKYRLKSGDILFARTGATTGKSYIVQDPPQAIFASYLIRLQPKSDILPEFLFWYFQSSSYWRAVYSGIEDGNRPNMNGTKLANLSIPYPTDKNEQRRIVKYFESLRAKIESLRELQEQVDAELASFVPALLAKAFRGEL